MTEHYFSRSPAAAAVDHEVRLVVDGRAVTLVAATGMFSHEHVDAGTRVLLDHAPPPPPEGTLLDLGCGWGPIACALALRAPAATIWAVDVNERALAYTSANAARIGAANVHVALPDAVPDGTAFDAIYSNPPIRIGKAALHELLLGWLARLAPGGRAYLVVQKNLGSDSLQRWLAGEGWSCDRLTSVRGFRVLSVGRVAA